jgi:hypothetical protein
MPALRRNRFCWLPSEVCDAFGDPCIGAGLVAHCPRAILTVLTPVKRVVEKMLMGDVFYPGPFISRRCPP